MNTLGGLVNELEGLTESEIFDKQKVNKLLLKHKSTSGLKSIKELLNYNFYIPSYQRGYRWGESQVEALLNDIWDFCKFYVRQFAKR